MEPCRSCGASLPAAATWCSQCFAARPGTPPTAAGTARSMFGSIPAQPAAPAQSAAPALASPVVGGATAGAGPSSFTASASPRAAHPPFGGSTGATTAGTGLHRPVTAATPLQSPVRRTRWGKTQTTFGPVGRVVSTVALVVPFLVMLVGGIVADPFALGGAGVWGFVIMPWGLRDVWKAGSVQDR